MYHHMTMGFTGLLASYFLDGCLTSLPTLPFFLPVFSLAFLPSYIFCLTIAQSGLYYQPVKASYICSVQKGYPTAPLHRYKCMYPLYLHTRKRRRDRRGAGGGEAETDTVPSVVV